MGDYSVFLGSGCIDKYFSVDFWPGMGDKVIAKQGQRRTGGTIANAACTTAAYGVKTYCLDVKAVGPEADFLLRDLESYGIDTSRIIRREGISDAYCAIVQDQTGERTVFVIKGDGDHSLIASGELFEFLANAGSLYGSLELEELLVNFPEVFRQQRLRGGRIAVDMELTVLKNQKWRLMAEQASVLYFNEFSIRRFAGELPDREFVEQLFAMGVETVVLTLGANGCRVMSRGGEDFSVPCYPVKVVDTTGAGDTFNSSFLAAQGFGWGLRECAEFATAAANLAVATMGPRGGVRSREEVLSFMRLHGRGI